MGRMGAEEEEERSSIKDLQGHAQLAVARSRLGARAAAQGWEGLKTHTHTHTYTHIHIYTSGVGGGTRHSIQDL